MHRTIVITRYDRATCRQQKHGAGCAPPWLVNWGIVTSNTSRCTAEAISRRSLLSASGCWLLDRVTCTVAKITSVGALMLSELVMPDAGVCGGGGGCGGAPLSACSTTIVTKITTKTPLAAYIICPIRLDAEGSSMNAHTYAKLSSFFAPRAPMRLPQTWSWKDCVNQLAASACIDPAPPSKSVLPYSTAAPNKQLAAL